MNEAQIHEVPCAVVLVVGEGDKVTAAKYAEDMEKILRRNANRCGKTALEHAEEPSDCSIHAPLPPKKPCKKSPVKEPW